jgi:hypothetical protein
MRPIAARHRSLAVLAVVAVAGCSTVATSQTTAPASQAPSSTAAATGGGPNASSATSSSEPFTAPTLSVGWQAVSPLLQARAGHTATTLKDGRVLVVGGEFDSTDAVGDPVETDLASTELFDPAAGRWTAGPPMPSPRSRHLALALADGRILVLGGIVADPNHLARHVHGGATFDPGTSSWSPVPNLPGDPIPMVAVVLHDGRVLVLAVAEGATDPSSPELVFVYDPLKNAWLTKRTYPMLRIGQTATVLADGTVLVAGGSRAFTELPDPQPDAAIYEPASDRWTPIGPMAVTLFAHTATLLPDGRALLVGERNAELFDPTTRSWSVAASPLSTHGDHFALLLPDGRVFVVGNLGDELGATRIAEAYDPARASWRAVGWYRDTDSLAAAELADGRVLVAGGWIYCMSGETPCADGITGNAYLFDPTAS